MANDLGKGDIEHDHKVVLEFIQVMMQEWGQELNKRGVETKMSIKGKTESTTYAQTRYGTKPIPHLGTTLKWAIVKNKTCF